MARDRAFGGRRSKRGGVWENWGALRGLAGREV